MEALSLSTILFGKTSLDELLVSQTWHICIWKVLINIKKNKKKNMAEFYEFMFLRMRKKGKAFDNNQQQRHH